jgi:hypothetical protein
MYRVRRATERGTMRTIELLQLHTRSVEANAIAAMRGAIPIW